MVDQTVLAPILEWGPPGAIIIALAWALWKRNERYDEVMEKRISEARESIDAMNRNTTAIDNLADLVRATRGGA